MVRSPALGRLSPTRLQYQLGDTTRVGKDALWITIDEDGAWRESLLQALDILTAGM